jgi:hypothetical protein
MWIEHEGQAFTTAVNDSTWMALQDAEKCPVESRRDG